ncbi:MAG TPA: hypothetical protein VKK79_10620, partial [Candidatus Lokiarchaeia archaeon]|nr:hypothetical protein [Candidatus Lokiarchaeia archaeon]
LQNLQSGLAQATGASEAEVGRFMEGAASQLMAKSPVKLPAKVMQVTVGDMQFPSTADLITRLRSNFGVIPRDLPLGKVLQVTSSAPSDMITGIIPPQSASSSDGISVSEYTKQRNRRTLYFTLAVVIGCVVLYVLSLFFGGGG